MEAPSGPEQELQKAVRELKDHRASKAWRGAVVIFGSGAAFLRLAYTNGDGLQPVAGED